MSENIIITTVIISTLIITLLVAMVAVVIFLANKQRVAQDIKMKELALSFEQELRKAETEMNESVLKHIARELHDNLAMLFTSANFGLNDYMFSNPEIMDQLLPTRDTLTNAIEQLRLFSRSLNKDYINSKTLTEMLEIETNRLMLLGRFNIHFSKNETPLGISKNQELLVFRIFQELIQNILKHANAQNIYIDVASENGFILCVKDDGVGFEMENAANKNGITNIKERAKLAELQCEYCAAPGKGCSVILSVENPKK